MLRWNSGGEMIGLPRISKLFSGFNPHAYVKKYYVVKALKELSTDGYMPDISRFMETKRYKLIILIDEFDLYELVALSGLRLRENTEEQYYSLLGYVLFDQESYKYKTPQYIHSLPRSIKRVC